MRRLVLCLLILVAFSPIAGCKRRAIKGTATARGTPPSAESIQSEELAKLKATLEEVPILSGGINFIDPTTGEVWERFPNGMMFQDLSRTQESAPQIGQLVSIAYTGKVFGAAKPFDSATAEKPFKFHLGGKQEAIKGMNMAVATLRLHSKRRVLIPPEFAYGSMGRPQAGIGPNNTLEFEIELVNIEGTAVSIVPAFTMPQPMGPTIPETSTAPATAPDAPQP